MGGRFTLHTFCFIIRSAGDASYHYCRKYKYRYIVVPELRALQSRIWGNPLKLQVVCPENGTAVLKG